ncbi:peptidoglycan DD-metalloendopeptidase family protein [Thermoanaerobacter mathranii]|uniref:peptidoglycan DD-metalloendopeptidase family protein n=1 Tax=Thermoanaerobacter mathranii TaxID=583357 RepID=UPI003AAD05B4
MRINREKLIRFFDRKGFYIILFLSIVVIAATSIYVTNNNLKKLEELRKAQQEEINSAIESDWSYEKELAQAQEEKEQQNNSTAVISQQTKENFQPVVENDEVKSSGKSDSSENSKVTTVMASNTSTIKKDNDLSSAKLVLLKPVNGDIILEFAKDKLVFSKTLQEWTTHKGVDIGTKLGEPVLAAMDGIVAKVYKDPKLGNTVVIKNGKWETRYANLEDEILVKQQEKVVKGQQIGKIGESARFEVSEGPHLHFELLENGTPVDPIAYFE